MFSIRSNSSDRELVFLGARPGYFTVELRGRNVNAIQEVYAYTDAHSLSSLLAKLAAYTLPWDGEQNWASLEDEFAISAACSTLGQVTFKIRIRGQLGGGEEWDVSASLLTEMGQLPGLSSSATAFFEACG